MSTQQLRNLLIDKISGIQDEQYLMAIKTILDANSATETPYQFTKEQEKEVLLAMEQAKNGEVISNEDLEKDEDEWLNA
jgi:hypothetical protein